MEYDKLVREIKKSVDAAGGFMETDPEGVAAATALQDATRLLLKARYGPIEPYRVKIDLEFQVMQGPLNQFHLKFQKL